MCVECRVENGCRCISVGDSDQFSQVQVGLRFGGSQRSGHLSASGESRRRCELTTTGAMNIVVVVVPSTKGSVSKGVASFPCFSFAKEVCALSDGRSSFEGTLDTNEANFDDMLPFGMWWPLVECPSALAWATARRARHSGKSKGIPNLEIS